MPMMNRFAIAMLLLLLPMGAGANTLPAGKDTEDIMVGVTGMFVALKDGELLVTQITPDTPAVDTLEKGDVLLAVDGASLEIQDPRQHGRHQRDVRHPVPSKICLHRLGIEPITHHQRGTG